MSREVEANTKLVKLHLQWPDRRKFVGKDEEALEFFKYLFLNFHADKDVMTLESEDQVMTFLEKNQRLLNAKPAAKKTKASNARIEPRIANDASVMLNVSESADPEFVGATSDGHILDVGLHGLQVNIDRNVPKGSQVTLSLVTEAGDNYELEAKTMWSRSTDGGQLLGLRILESAGFKEWQSDFGAKFVAPKLARQVKPRKQ